MHDSRMSEDESRQDSVCRSEMPGFFRGVRAKPQHEFQARLPTKVLPMAQQFTKHVLFTNGLQKQGTPFMVEQHEKG